MIVFMKKIISYNSLAIFIFLLLFLNIDDITAFSINWIIAPMLMPIVSGLLSALLQDKDRSYSYVPSILSGAIFFSFVSIFFWKLILYFIDKTDYSFLAYINPFNHDGLDLTLILLVAYMAGGLVGIAIRGANLVFLPTQKFHLHFNISFIISFLLGALTLLGVNIYYVLISIPPDGRWKFQIPVTSLFVILYLAIFFLVSKKLIKDPQLNHWPWAYNALLSLAFITNARAVQIYFQDSGWQYLRYVATAPYMVILSLGVVCFPLALYLQRKAIKENN